MRNKFSIFIFGLIVILFLAGFFIKRAMAVPIGLKIMPIKVSYTLKPNETVTDKINLTNPTPETIQVQTKVEDFIPVAGAEGAQFIGRAEGMTTVRDWVSLDAPEKFQLTAGVTKEVSFTINAPENAEPGSHFGVIFFKATSLSPTGQLQIGTQVGTLVYVTVPGSRLQKGKILEFKGPKFIQKGPVSFTIKFENTGTVHFEPKGTIKITDIFSRKVGEVPVQGKVVLPTGVRDLGVVWQTKGMLLGGYKAEVEIKDGEGNILTAKSIYFYAFPVFYTLYFLLTFIILFYLLKFLRTKLKISVSIK